MSLRPPSVSPSPSPGPENGRATARQSMGPAARGTPTLAPASPRPGGPPSARPTSELLGTGGMSFQTPEAEALDQWFENLQNYEATLEDMAAASLDVNFKEELSAIEQWFKVLSEAERTAALYSLLQHSTQVQIRFFITVLQQMARSDPMTALLSPAMGSMQSQMESKLVGLKTPGLKSGLPASPTARNFSGNRQSLILDSNSNFLSPESAATPPDSAAATLAQQRAKLKASNASHRISAPVLATGGADIRASWGPSQLSQVSEAQSPSTADIPNSASRPKSTEFSGSLGTPRAEAPVQEANANNSWASMVNTPLIPMFKKETKPSPPAPETLKGDWHSNPGPGVPRMGDPTIHRRNQKKPNESGQDGSFYDENGNPVQNGGGPRGGRTGNYGRSPALNNNQPNRFGHEGSDAGGSMNGLGMQMGNFGGMGGGMGLASPTMGMGMPGLGMQPMSPFNMLGMMSPEAQMLAAQMAASGFGQPGVGVGGWLGMQPMSAGLAGQMGPGGGRKNNGPGSARSPAPHSARSTGSRAEGTPKAEEDVDPSVLGDIPAWLRSLRLHKYTPNFEGCKWQDMVMMDEKDLEAKGVAALGARRKMMKTFEIVRKKMGIEGGPPGSAVPSSAGLKSP
ncbi:hypothetical protein CPB83DRAFT_845997 [Crepidotus variabilis]|uniref:RNA-binding protein VTS1 n=1 Tax=Crepidotus variabilis TaxID=179855 RepID=A0A9P6JV64_9AGAR|nr:hypothetical protein CPB83DRAFT_845997 [Crepidotus variabilis]